MEQNTPKFRLKLNLFDGIILVLALAAAGVMLWMNLKPETPAQGDQQTASTVRYTVRMQRCDPGVADLIQPGDGIADNVKKYDLGKVVSAETAPAEVQVLDQVNRRYVQAVLEGYEDVLLTVEAPCSVSDDRITVGGGYDLRVGNTAYLRGTGYFGSGPIVSIEEVQG